MSSVSFETNNGMKTIELKAVRGYSHLYITRHEDNHLGITYIDSEGNQTDYEFPEGELGDMTLSWVGLTNV